jgi:hypothetical protein
MDISFHKIEFILGSKFSQSGSRLRHELAPYPTARATGRPPSNGARRREYGTVAAGMRASGRGRQKNWGKHFPIWKQRGRLVEPPSRRNGVRPAEGARNFAGRKALNSHKTAKQSRPPWRFAEPRLPPRENGEGNAGRLRPDLRLGRERGDVEPDAGAHRRGDRGAL